MTNHDENTRDKPRPTTGKVVVEAVFMLVMIGVLIWLVARYPENPRWYDRAGLLVYALFTGFFLSSTVKLARRRWAPQEPVVSTSPVAYLDRDGDRWNVRPNGALAYIYGGVLPREVVEQDYGPLTPIYG